MGVLYFVILKFDYKKVLKNDVSLIFQFIAELFKVFNTTALRIAKTPSSFGYLECSSVKIIIPFNMSFLK